MVKHQEPANVVAYKEAIKSGPPKCCHTCDHYLGNGHCYKYDMEPPEDFAATMNACPSWLREVPF